MNCQFFVVLLDTSKRSSCADEKWKHVICSRDTDQARCSYGCGQQGQAQTTPAPPPSAEPPSITIHSSQLNCVIIGDNNYMHADQSHSTEAEEVWRSGRTELTLTLPTHRELASLEGKQR